MTPSPVDSSALAEIARATAAVQATVASATDAELAEPSVLPDWSRAHVVAHLGLNAAGMIRLFEGLAKGQVLPFYDSVEKRNADIEAWAALPAADLRARFNDAADGWEPAVLGVPADGWQTAVERVPGQPFGSALRFITTRHREVEIHHCDLDLGYPPAAWPESFVISLLDSTSLDRAAGPGMLLEPDDIDQHWLIGPSSDVPTVRGHAAAIAWWLIGRGDGSDLRSDADGGLPTIGAWV